RGAATTAGTPAGPATVPPRTSAAAPRRARRCRRPDACLTHLRGRPIRLLPHASIFEGNPMATMSRLAGALLFTSALTVPNIAFAQQADPATAPADLPPTAPLDDQ